MTFIDGPMNFCYKSCGIEATYLTMASSLEAFSFFTLNHGLPYCPLQGIPYQEESSTKLNFKLVHPLYHFVLRHTDLYQVVPIYTEVYRPVTRCSELRTICTKAYRPVLRCTEMKIKQNG